MAARLNNIWTSITSVWDQYLTFIMFSPPPPIFHWSLPLAKYVCKIKCQTGTSSYHFFITFAWRIHDRHMSCTWYHSTDTFLREISVVLTLSRIDEHTNELHVRETCFIPGRPQITELRCRSMPHCTKFVLWENIVFVLCTATLTFTKFLSIKVFFCSTGNKCRQETKNTLAINIYKCRRTRHHDFLQSRLENNLTMQGAGAVHTELQLGDQPRGEDWLHSVRRDVLRTCTLHWSVFPPQSTYRGRVEIGGVHLPSQLERIHHNLVRDGRNSERGVGMHPPALTRLG